LTKVKIVGIADDIILINPNKIKIFIPFIFAPLFLN